MPDDSSDAPQDTLPEHFAVRLEHGGHVHYILCEAVISFDESKLFQSGVNALRDMFREFSQSGAAEVAVLPPPGSSGWTFFPITMQSADDGN